MKAIRSKSELLDQVLAQRKKANDVLIARDSNPEEVTDLQINRAEGEIAVCDMILTGYLKYEKQESEADKTLRVKMHRAYNYWCENHLKLPVPKKTAYDHMAMNQIITALTSAVQLQSKTQNPSDEDILTAWMVLMANWDDYQVHIRHSHELKTINRNLAKMMSHLRNTMSNSSKAGQKIKKKIITKHNVGQKFGNCFATA